MIETLADLERMTEEEADKFIKQSRMTNVIIVYKLLLNNEECRNNDNLLYTEYIKTKLKLTDKELQENFYELYTNYFKYNILNMNSVERLRRKLQETDREQETYLIQSNYYIQKLRNKKEQKMKEEFSNNSERGGEWTQLQNY